MVRKGKLPWNLQSLRNTLKNWKIGSGQKRNERHDDRRAPRGTGARPGGWVGRGPAFTGGMDRVTAPFTGRSISSL